MEDWEVNGSGGEDGGGYCLGGCKGVLEVRRGGDGCGGGGGEE